MQYSGLLITFDLHAFDDSVVKIGDYPGIDVYTTDPARAQAVVVLETETVEEQEEQFREIQRLAYVRCAELVYHYFGDTCCHPESLDNKVSGIN